MRVARAETRGIKWGFMGTLGRYLESTEKPAKVSSSEAS